MKLPWSERWWVHLACGLAMTFGSAFIFWDLTEWEAHPGESRSMNWFAALIYRVGGKWALSGLVLAVGLFLTASGLGRMRKQRRRSDGPRQLPVPQPGNDVPAWVARPLTCGGEIVLAGLDPARLADADLRSLCLRMHVILETIEHPRCEGRLIPFDLFNSIDTLESAVLHGHGGPAKLTEWLGLVRKFGEYYRLRGCEPIPVDSTIYREMLAQYALPPASSATESVAAEIDTSRPDTP